MNKWLVLVGYRGMRDSWRKYWNKNPKPENVDTHSFITHRVKQKDYTLLIVAAKGKVTRQQFESIFSRAGIETADAVVMFCHEFKPSPEHPRKYQPNGSNSKELDGLRSRFMNLEFGLFRAAFTGDRDNNYGGWLADNVPWWLMDLKVNVASFPQWHELERKVSNPSDIDSFADSDIDLGKQFQRLREQLGDVNALPKIVGLTKQRLPNEPEVLRLQAMLSKGEYKNKDVKKILDELQKDLPDILKRYRSRKGVPLKIRLILLEDDKEFRNKAKKALAKQGFGVKDTENPQTAINWIKNDHNGKIECALLDWEIGRDQTVGPNVCRQIKSFRPQVRVYALTHILDPKSPRVTARAHFDDYFYKPTINWTDIALQTRLDVGEKRKEIPLYCTFDQERKDAYYKLVEKPDSGLQDFQEVVREGCKRFNKFLRRQIATQTLGDLYGAGSKPVNIKNILMGRVVILGMYRYFNLDDYMVFCQLNYPPQLNNKSRKNVIDKGLQFVTFVMSKVKAKTVSVEGIIGNGYPHDSDQRADLLYKEEFDSFELLQNGSERNDAIDFVVRYNKPGNHFKIRYKWFKSSGNVIVAEDLKFSKAFEVYLKRCGFDRRTLPSPDAWFPHEKDLLKDWPKGK